MRATAQLLPGARVPESPATTIAHHAGPHVSRRRAHRRVLSPGVGARSGGGDDDALAAGQHLVDQAVLLGLDRREDLVPLDVGADLLLGLPGVEGDRRLEPLPVSYTHLTLPTIY